jgi:hypothetical protein
MPSYASDGDCDGGGPGAEYLGCQLGTDCAGADCCPRFRLPPPICAETCNWRLPTTIATTAAPARSSAPGPGTNSKVCVCVHNLLIVTNQPGHAHGLGGAIPRLTCPW